MKKHYVTAYIKRMSDGRIKHHDAWVPDDLDGPNTFCWEEGNDSCDCNRHIYFEGEYCGSPCGDQESYQVNVKSRETGEWLYREYE